MGLAERQYMRDDFKMPRRGVPERGSFKPRRRNKILLVIAAVIGTIVLVAVVGKFIGDVSIGDTTTPVGGSGASLAVKSADATTSAQEANAKPRTGNRQIPTRPRVKLSEPATRVARLLDEGKHDAADALLESYFSRFPDDGGLFAQKARSMVATTDLVAFTDREDDGTALRTTCRRAVQFDEHLKPYVAHVLIGAVYQQLQETVDNGGYIELRDAAFTGPGGAVESENIAVFFLDALSNQFLEGNWSRVTELAHELDPAAARDWMPSFARLIPRLIDEGWYVSAIRLGILVGAHETAYDEKVKFRRSLEVLNQIMDDAEQRADRCSRPMTAFIVSQRASEKRQRLAIEASRAGDPLYGRTIHRWRACFLPAR